MITKKRESDGATLYLLDDDLIRQAFIDAANQEWDDYEKQEPSFEENKNGKRRRKGMIKK